MTMGTNRYTELGELKRAIRFCAEGVFEVLLIVDGLVATADPRALPLLARVADEHGRRHTEVKAAVIEGMVGFGWDGVTYAKRRLAQRDEDRFIPLVVLARSGDRRAMRELVREHLCFGYGAQATVTQLLQCERAGMEELVAARGTRTRIKLAYTLAARRPQTEATLLDIVNESRNPEDLPAPAIHALALMPSAKAERAFMRVLLAPPKDEALREYATKGLERLKALRGRDVDPAAAAETAALHRATRGIRGRDAITTTAETTLRGDETNRRNFGRPHADGRV